MFKKEKPKPEPTELDKAISHAFETLEQFEPNSDEYVKITKQIQLLTNLRNESKDKADKISKDALLAGAVSLAGIIAILGYEKANVITSKALGFVFKTKI